MPYGPSGGPMRPHHMQGPPAAAAAAAGGYGVPRGVPGPADRNVRPRHSGGGGMPVGAAGPAAGHAGFKPGGAYRGLYGCFLPGGKIAAVGEAVQQHMRQTEARQGASCGGSVQCACGY